MDTYVYVFIFIYNYLYLFVCIYVSLISSAQCRPTKDLETQDVQTTANAKSVAFLCIHYMLFVSNNIC